jgi:hypothetical protein
VPARVLGHACYGPDTVLELALDSAGTKIEARTFDQDLPSAGEPVEVAVAGPVFTYPAVAAPAPMLSASAV